MLSPEELISIVNECLLIKLGTKKGSVPKYSLTYEESLKKSKEVEIHADGVFPKSMFKKRAPGENKVQWEYRKENYESVTRPAWERALSTINRIWNRSNFNIDWSKEESADDQVAYFTEEFPTYGSIIDYYKQVFTPFKIKDPNAVRAIRPKSVPTTVNEEGEVVFDQSAMIEPIPIIYGTKQVLKFVEDHYAVILLQDQSWLDINVIKDKDKKKKGMIFEVYDDTAIYEIKQVRDITDSKFPVKAFEFQIFYAHNLGRLPVKKLKGKPKQFETETMYESYFQPAIPSLNLALHDSSNLQISKTTHAFPQKWQIAAKCKQCKGHGHRMINDKRVPCDACNETGLLVHNSPMQVHQIDPPSDLDDKRNIPNPPAGYIEQNDTILQFLRNEFNSEVVSAFTFVGIDITNSIINGGGSDETATRSRINREETFSFIKQISDESWSDLNCSIEDIGEMRFGKSFKEPAIAPPVDFAIRSLDEITQEIGEAKEAGLPTVGTSKLIKEYINVRFNSIKDVAKITDLVFKSDRVVSANNQEIASMMATKRLSVSEAVLHDSIFNIIENLMDEDEKFLDKSFEDQKKAIDEVVAEIVAQLQQPVGTTDNLVAQANGLTAEAS